MRMLAFAVYDRAGCGFSAPYFQVTRGLGERMFAQAAMDPESQISKTPGDFELHEVGEFDTDTGVFVPRERPELLVTGVQVLSLRAVGNG